MENMENIRRSSEVWERWSIQEDIKIAINFELGKILNSCIFYIHIFQDLSGELKTSGKILSLQYLFK